MKKFDSIMDLLIIMESYYNYLEGKILFNENGWPIFNQNMFLDEWPDFVVPFYHRNSTLIEKEKTVICFYCCDSCIHQRMIKLFDEIETYKTFLGVIEPDLTITTDMDIEMQNLLMLCNQLFIAILAINGIKIVMNTRNGKKDTLQNFNSIPFNIIWASSLLGCVKASNRIESIAFIDKILYLLPSKLILYGKHDYMFLEEFNNLGFKYRTYEDFHTFSKKRRVQK